MNCQNIHTPTFCLSATPYRQIEHIESGRGATGFSHSKKDQNTEKFLAMTIEIAMLNMHRYPHPYRGYMAI